MSSDYEAITKYNERQLGLDTESRKTQISMYSDPTHFIYEILQNADDYGATEVIFKLSKDKLIIEHNGEPFTEENVKAITYFGKSTSREDLVKTGRFGVGFKSVFAYTANPTIFSGDEHFQIYGLYRIKEQPYPNEFSSSLTQIILPFNHESEQPNYVEKLVSPKEAYTKISNRLKKLNMNTLLFTLNIQEIRWEIDNHSGNYYREDVVYDNSEIDNVRKTTITDGNKLKEYWVFSKIPRWKNQYYKAIDVAFAIDENNQLMPVDDFLFVLFATTEKPDLKFILNGPYRTNPSRETISKDDKFNQHLIKETCELFKEILPNLKKMDLLTTHFLNVLPSGNDDLSEFYTPILNIIIETFNNDELVPTDDNQFASSGNIFQGPAVLREVITKEELPFFTGYDKALWAKGIQQNSRADHFLRDLNIEHWGWKNLQDTLRSKFGRYYLYGIIDHYVEDEDYAWLAARKDSWLIKLYIMLAEAIRKDECDYDILKRCRIIRVLKNGEVNHVAGSEAYFPKGHSYDDLPQIKHSLLKSKNEQEAMEIQESLISLGVSEIGEEEKIDLLLETFYSDKSTKITKKQHLGHIRAFIEWYKKVNNANKFIDYSIFKTVGNDDFHPSEKCFLDSPLRKTGLNIIYSKIKSGISRKAKLWSSYRELANNGFIEFAIACGVADGLHILQQSCYNHPKWAELGEDSWARQTYTGKDEDYYIPNLSKLLGYKVRGISLLIWQTVRKVDPKVFEANYRPNRQYKTRSSKSSFLLELMDAAWIPNKRGQLKKPSELTKEQLHRDFKYDNRNGWLDEIEFGEDSKKASKEYSTLKEGASAFGIPVEQLNFLAALTEEEKNIFNKEIKALVKLREKEHNKAKRSRQENIPFHEALSGAFTSKIRHTTIQNQRGHGSTKNPSRRRKRVSEDIAVAIENENHIKERFSFTLRKKWKGKDDQVRVTLAEWYEGKCQICRETFIQRSGEPYFEGLYLVPYTNAEWLDRVGNVICLCALHSSMFQFGPKEIEEDIISQIMKMSVKLEGGDGEPAISMKLCGNMININYAENHLIDLQEMIKLAQESERNQKGEEN